jgi:hypothetical protein
MIIDEDFENAREFNSSGYGLASISVQLPKCILLAACNGERE